MKARSYNAAARLVRTSGQCTAKFERKGLMALQPRAWGLDFEVELAGEAEYEERDGVAIVSICGPLTQHTEWFWDSYDSIKERVKAALASPAKAVILELDSPGGDVAGCFETSREIRAMADAAKKPLYAIADSLAASAAYSLACAADFIACPESAFVGSVGVIDCLVDLVAMNQRMGVNVAVITSGARKADGHPDNAITKDAVASSQERVDSLAQGFFEWVSERRGMSVDAVRALEANVFHGKAAVDAGLANEVMTKEELLAMVASSSSKPGRPQPPTEAKMGWKQDMQKAADEGDDEAKKCLAALDEEDEKKAKGDEAPKDEPDGDEKKAAGDEPDGDEPPTCSEPCVFPAKKDDEKKAAAKAQHKKVLAALGQADQEKADLDARVAKLEKENEAKERSAVLASRPDLTTKQKEYLAALPTPAAMAEALEAFPPPTTSVGGNGREKLARAATRGAGQGDGHESRLPREQAEELAERMGVSTKKPKVEWRGNARTFPQLDKDTAREMLKQGAEGGAR